MSGPGLLALASGLGIELDAERAARVEAYLDAMLAENRHLNLTAVRDPAAALVLHALDSVAIGLATVDARRALDLGSGNGFPGVGVWGACPGARVTLLERTEKKAAAIERCVDRAALDDVDVRWTDAAQLPAAGLRGAFTLVTARAVATPDKVARLARPLLARDGRLALWVADAAELPAPRELGFAALDAVSYELPEPARRHRRLGVYSGR